MPQVFIELSDDLTDGTTWTLTITVLAIRFTSSQSRLRIAVNICLILYCNYFQGRNGYFDLDNSGNQEANIKLFVWTGKFIEVYFANLLLRAFWLVLLLLLFWGGVGITCSWLGLWHILSRLGIVVLKVKIYFFLDCQDVFFTSIGITYIWLQLHYL